MNESITIRFAQRADVPLVLELIRDLAAYEKLSHEVEATEEMIAKSLFEQRAAEALIAEVDGASAGLALFFHNYSTFVGKRGLYLEDLFVKPLYRGRGVGLALFRRLAQIARERDCGRMEWWVLDWNAQSIAFYESLGAKPMNEWTVFRLTGDALRDLAG